MILENWRSTFCRVDPGPPPRAGLLSGGAKFSGLQTPRDESTAWSDIVSRTRCKVARVLETVISNRTPFCSEASRSAQRAMKHPMPPFVSAVMPELAGVVENSPALNYGRAAACPTLKSLPLRPRLHPQPHHTPRTQSRWLTRRVWSQRTPFPVRYPVGVHFAMVHR